MGTFKYTGDETDLAVTAANLSGHTWTRVSASDPLLANQTLSYDGNGSDSGSVSPQTVAYNGSLIVSANGFSRTGYAFSGWNTQADGEGTAYAANDVIDNITANIALYAQWIGIDKTISFNGNGSDSGSTASITVTYGAGAVTLPSNGFTKTGYTFSKWNTQADGEGTDYASDASVSDLLSDLVLYAQWTANIYIVSFDGNGNTGGSTLSVSVTYGAGAVALPSNGFTRTGYNFAGWMDADGATYSDGQSISNITSNITLYAQWEAKDYTVTFIGNGNTGGSTASMKVTYGAAPVALTANGYTKTGYSFTEWNASPTGSGIAYSDKVQVSNLLEDLVLYAQWSAETYYVSFDANGGTGTMDKISVTYDAGDVFLTANAFTRTGYTFTGWNTAADGSGTAYDDKDPISNIPSDITLYAQWTINTYTVTYDANGGSGSTDAQTVTHGGSIEVSSNGFTRTGYTFSKWNTQADGNGTPYSAGDEIDGITSGLTLYAQWTADTHYVNFHANGGTGTMSLISVVYDGSAAIIPDSGFARTGYMFSYWNTQADGSGTSYAVGASVNDLFADLDLYAQWAANTYTVTFYANGGTGTMSSLSVVYDGSAVAIPDNGFIRTGYTFSGWNTKADGSGASYAVGTSVRNIADDLDLYAQWTADTYTVSFDGNGSTSGTTASMQVTYGEAAKALTANDFARTGYTFSGWKDADGNAYSDGQNVSDLLSDITLYAQWTADTYMVSFSGNGSTSGTTDSVAVTYDAGPVTLTANGFIRTGYTFVGWNTQADGEGVAYTAGAEISNITSDLTLYAQWTINTYTVSYDSNGGDRSSAVSQTVTYGGSLNTLANTFIRTGYTFSEWNTQSNGGGVSYAAGAEISDVTSDITLYAQWAADTYTVSFVGNGSTSGTTAPLSVVYDADPVALTANGFSRTGYTFTGWNTQADGEGTAYSDGASVSDLLSDLTLYAQWTSNTYTVSFDGNGSTAGSTASVSVTYGAGAVFLTANGFSRTGYTFTGWNTAADGSGAAYSEDAEIANIASDLTLYAQWTADTYTVYFYGNGGSGPDMSMQVTYDAGPCPLPADTFVREDYTFTGWNTAADGSGTSYADGQEISDLTSDLVLYAQWERIGGTGVDVSPLAAFIAVLVLLIAGGAVFAAPFMLNRL